MKTLIISRRRIILPIPKIRIGDLIRIHHEGNPKDTYAKAVYDNGSDDCHGCVLCPVTRCTGMGCITHQFILKRVDDIMEDI